VFNRSSAQWLPTPPAPNPWELTDTVGHGTFSNRLWTGDGFLIMPSSGHAGSRYKLPPQPLPPCP
jgi:hypothetical protein